MTEKHAVLKEHGKNYELFRKNVNVLFNFNSFLSFECGFVIYPSFRALQIPGTLQITVCSRCLPF